MLPLKSLLFLTSLSFFKEYTLFWLRPELKPATAVSIFNWQVYDQWKAYFNIGVPNVIIIFFDWSTFEVMTLFAGYIGVAQQAVQIILLNLLALLLPYGTK